MINYTKRLDGAIRRAAWAHEQQKQHRTCTDIPYIIHPFGVMTIAGSYTDDEDTLISCLMHDILEDISPEIYNEFDLELEFGGDVVSIIKDVTKDSTIRDWRERSDAYLTHLDESACHKAVIVSAADKMHNLLSTLADYEVVGEKLWQRFSTKSSVDQLWWYESILEIVSRRSDLPEMNEKFTLEVKLLKEIVVNRQLLHS